MGTSQPILGILQVILVDESEAIGLAKYTIILLGM